VADCPTPGFRRSASAADARVMAGARARRRSAEREKKNHGGGTFRPFRHMNTRFAASSIQLPGDTILGPPFVPTEFTEKAVAAISTHRRVIALGHILFVHHNFIVLSRFTARYLLTRINKADR